MSNKWSSEEVILALYAYCHVPFNKASNTNTWIVRIAKLIGRTPAAVKMKIGNLGAFDPQLKAKGIVGLSGTSKLDREIWEAYYGNWDKLSYDAEILLSQLENRTIEETWNLPEGKDVFVMTKRRINQSFFRSAVLSSYNNTCCISGITHPNLLEACHIVGWSEDSAIRTDPMNGLCLTPTFHKAFDNLLISITPDYILKISESFKLSASKSSFGDYLKLRDNCMIILPDRFMPHKEYLEKNYDRLTKIN
ncbi:MAG: HNH endonuclease [Muribaculaceae bacterium]|nr:HNH endonuclease [Muribaculaceae bacterium]